MSLEAVGKILKSKRKELGLEIKDIASDLRLKSKSLEDVEQGSCDFSDVYVLGYIRMYSKYLGVNIDANSIQERNINVSTQNNEHYLSEDEDVSVGIPSLRVVTVTVIVLVLSIMFVVFSSDEVQVDTNTYAVNKLKIDVDRRVVTKKDHSTYIIHKHLPLVIKATDSVEVQVLDVDNHVLEKLNLRIGEVVSLSIHNNKTAMIRTNIPDSIEVITKN